MQTKMMEQRVIDVNSLEMAEVLLFLAKDQGLTVSEMEEQKLGICGIMAIDNYMTGGPGFTGQLYIISWAGAPEYITVVGKSANPKFRHCGELILIGNLGHCSCCTEGYEGGK